MPSGRGSVRCSARRSDCGYFRSRRAIAGTWRHRDFGVVSRSVGRRCAWCAGVVGRCRRIGFASGLLGGGFVGCRLPRCRLVGRRSLSAPRFVSRSVSACLHAGHDGRSGSGRCSPGANLRRWALTVLDRHDAEQDPKRGRADRDPREQIAGLGAEGAWPPMPPNAPAKPPPRPRWTTPAGSGTGPSTTSRI